MEDNLIFKTDSADTTVHRFQEHLDNNNSDSVEKLKLLLADYTGLPTDNILPTTGQNRAMQNIFKALASSGDQILIYGGYNMSTISDLALRYGLTSRNAYPKTPFVAFCEDITDRIDSNTKLIYLSNPNRITGAIMNCNEIESILETNDQMIVIVDESLFEFYRSSCADLVDRYDNLIILRSFSEGFQLKSGETEYLISSKNIIHKLTRANGNQYSTPSIDSAILALNILDHQKSRWNRIKESLIYLSIKLRSLGVSCRISPADFILIKVKNRTFVMEYLKRKNHRAVDLSDFSELENYIKISLDNENETQTIIDTFEQIPSAYLKIKKISDIKLKLVRKGETNSEKCAPNRPKTEKIFN